MSARDAMVSALWDHYGPSFAEGGKDRGGLNCACGAMFTPGPDGLRPWSAYMAHFADALLAVASTSEAHRA